MRDWEEFVRQHLSLPELKPEREKRIVRELAAQFEDFYCDALSRGLTEDEADQFAQRQIRDWECFASDVRRADRAYTLPRLDQWSEKAEEVARRRGGGWLMFADLQRDVLYGLRMLAKNPGFTAVAVLTLALGIGANTGAFGFVNALFLQPLPFPEADRVVRFYATSPRGNQFDTFSYPNYADVRDRNQVFAHLAAHQNVTVPVSVGEQPVTIRGELVTGNYFSVLGVGAALGRTLLPSDDETIGADPVAVISNGLWMRGFGADPDVAGRTLRLNGHSFTVVGVMPEGFRGSHQAFVADFWVPMMMHEQIRPRGTSLMRRGWGWLNGTGRLKPGVSLEQAQAEVNRVASQLAQDFPRLNEGWGYALYPASGLPEQFRSGASGFLGFFMLIVSLVLLVACANIASVLLARVVGRQREIAIRQSLGAGRGRLIRQWITESVLLSLLGGAAGLVVAYWTQRGLLALFAPVDFLASFSPDLGFDSKVLGFTFLVALLTGVLFGLFPALRAGRVDVTTALKEESGTAAGGRRRSRLFGVFVVSQVSVSLVLLIATGLLLRTLREAEAFDLGFNSRNLLLAQVNLAPYGYDEVRGKEFYRQLTERLSALPGVESVTFASVVPLGGGVDKHGFRIEGYETAPDKPWVSIDTNVVGPDYFAALAIPILRGRDFSQRDAQPGAQPVVVINETMARRFWPGQDPVGRRFQYWGTDGPFLEIIGVARDIKYYSLAERPRPYVYASYAQSYISGATLHLRTIGNPKALIGSVRNEVAALDPNLPVSNLTTYAELRQIPLLAQRALASVTSVFAVLALALTAIGLYGMVSYSVTQRTHEIGIRMALGAQQNDILKLVVGQGMTLTLVGVALGLAGAFAVTRFLESLLFGVTPTDPVTFAAVSLLLVGVALLACYIPARRAAKIEPMVALRYE